MRAAIAALALILSATTRVVSGATGGIMGTIVDENGAPVYNVLVTASSRTNILRTHTNACGSFSFLNLVPDAYTLSLDKNAFQPLSYAGLMVTGDPQYHPERDLVPVRKFDLVNKGAGDDIYIVDTRPFGGFPNPVGMALMTVPGINVGFGGFPH